MNKKALAILLLSVFSFSATQARTHKHKHHTTKKTVHIAEIKEHGPVFTFKGGDSFDFKAVKKDATVSHCFQFTNTGDKTLFIDNVKANCLCANVKWDVEPILPGMKGHIYVSIDVRQLKGEFYKELYILANSKNPLAENRYTLFISGNIETESYKPHDDRVAGW